MRSGLWFSAALLGVALAFGSWLVLDNLILRGEVKREGARGRAAPAPHEPARHPVTASLAQPSARPATFSSQPVIDEALPPEPSLTREQRTFELQQRYEAAPVPDGRAVTIGRALTQDLERVLADESRLVSVDCKATICRAVIAFPAIEADRDTFAKLLQPMEGPVAEFGFSVTRETSPTGAVTSTIFMLLEGKDDQSATREREVR